MNVNGGHEFVCKRCKKPLDVDVSILARLDSFDDLDKTLEMMVPSSYATSPTSSLLFSKGSKAATFKHSPSFVKRSSGGSGSSRSASPSPSSGGGEREKDVCVSDSGFELLLPERTPLPIDSSAPSSLSSSTAGSTSTSPPSSPSLGSSSSVAHSLPPHLTSTLSAPLMRKNPPAASTPSSSSSSPSASSSSSQVTTQPRPFSGYGSGTYAASIPLSQRRSNYSSSNNSNVFSSSSSIATLSTTATKRKKKNVPAHSMTKLLEVFEQTSEMTEMDHPLCAGCTESVLVELEEELEEAYKENLSYERYLQALSLEEREEGGGIGAGEKEKGDGGEEDEEKPEEERGEEEEEDERRKKKEEEEQQSMATSPYLNRIQRVDAEIKQLEDEEKALKEQLLMIEAERKQLEDEEQDLKRDQAKIEDIERRYWENYNEFQAKLHAFQEERDAVKMSIEKANSQLELLKKTNVYNDAFHVWHDGHFGTINGRRLGTLPSQQVPWDEINAAWGQATLLLYTIAKQLNFTFSSFRLVPMGSSSKVIKLEDESEYELYGANDYKVLKVFWFRRFDTAMMGFLKCLKELGDYVESEDKRFRLPYRMDRDKIGKMSIKNQFNSPETWTKALKYTLTNLKWLLAWMARRQ
ncbi:Vacuolar protein sorting-associated protein atg6 [Balamuthia mandrillaris]